MRLHERRVWERDRGIPPVGGRTIDREGANNLLVGRGRRSGGREVRGGHAVTPEPRTRIALLEHRGENGVAVAGRRDKDGVVTRLRPFREERLIAVGVHAVHGGVSRSRALHPHGCISRIVCVAINAERDHSVALRGPLVEIRLVLRCSRAVICLEQHGTPSGMAKVKIDRSEPIDLVWGFTAIFATDAVCAVTQPTSARGRTARSMRLWFARD